MNTIVTSKEEILKISRDMIQQQGWSAVNIRSVAAACGVSVGSIYNYFDSKAELMGAVVESVWHEIFTVQKMRACFRTRKPASHGYTDGWNMAANNTPDFLLFILWDLCRRRNPMENGGCSGPGSTFWMNYVPS